MIEETKAYVKSSIRTVPDFPKAGILFYDVTTLVADPVAFQAVIDDFRDRYADKNIEAVAGFEARGFIFGAPLALALKVPFILLRKPGKLPGAVVSAEYQLEYGSDKLEVSVGALKPGQRVLLLDDLMATGGTMAAGAQLMKLVGAEVVEAAVIIEFFDFKGKDKLGSIPLYAILPIEGM